MQTLKNQRLKGLGDPDVSCPGNAMNVQRACEELIWKVWWPSEPECNTGRGCGTVGDRRYSFRGQRQGVVRYEKDIEFVIRVITQEMFSNCLSCAIDTCVWEIASQTCTDGDKNPQDHCMIRWWLNRTVSCPSLTIHHIWPECFKNAVRITSFLCFLCFSLIPKKGWYELDLGCLGLPHLWDDFVPLNPHLCAYSCPIS